ncbi:MAG: YitT family protein [Pirellula sp.]
MDSKTRIFLDSLKIFLGVFVAALGLASFLVPNHFIDGGITGVSMLIAKLTGIPLAWWLVIVNLPFLIVGDRYVGREFSIKSAIGIVGLAILVAWVPFPVATNDKLLGSVFGGFFLGAGVGMAIRSGGVLDGTEILALILSSRTFATVGEIIMALNVVIFSTAVSFLGVESALYSMLTYLTASKTIDYLLHGFEAYNGVMIITEAREAIRKQILHDLGRGVTQFRTLGGYSGADQEVLFCVITRLENAKLEQIVHAHDPNAFMVILPVLEAKGGVIKRRSIPSVQTQGVPPGRHSENH